MAQRIQNVKQLGLLFLVQGSGYHGISGVKLTSNHLAVYTVEMIGILLALQWVEEHKYENVLICSDSVAVLKSLISFKSSHQDILFSILQIHSRITERNNRDF